MSLQDSADVDNTRVPGLEFDGPDGWIIPARDDALQNTPEDSWAKVEGIVLAITIVQ